MACDVRAKALLIDEAFNRLYDLVSQASFETLWDISDPDAEELEEIEGQAKRAVELATGFLAAVQAVAPPFNLITRAVLDENTCAACLAADGLPAPEAEPPPCERVKNGDGVCRCRLVEPPGEADGLRAQVVVKSMAVDPPHLTAVLEDGGKMYSAAGIGERLRGALVNRVVAQALAARKKAGA